MDFVVVGSDGKDYGPIAEDVLKVWVAEDRIRPDSTLKDFQTGRTLLAKDVPGLYGPPIQTPNYANPYSGTTSNYAPQSSYTAPTLKDSSDMGPLWGVVLRCAAALVLFFVLQGLGLVFSGFALFYAIKAKSEGNKYGLASIVIAAVTLAIVGTGWILRLKSVGP